jgi:hypothetical protein
MTPWCPLDRRLVGAQSRSGRSGEEKNSQPLPGFEPPIIQLVVQPYTNELSRLFHTSALFYFVFYVMLFIVTLPLKNLFHLLLGLELRSSTSYFQTPPVL